MEALSNDDLFRHWLAELARQYVRRAPAPDPPPSAVEEPEPTHFLFSPSARLLTADELQELTSIKRTWWLAEARADRIPHIRAGKYVRFEFPEVVRFLRESSPSLRDQR